MKFLKSLLLFSSILGIASAGSSSSVDTEGELSIEKYCDDEKVELECEWEAKASRRVRRGRRGLKQVQVPGDESRNHRVLDVELDDVECSLEVGDDDYHMDLDFPEDFCVEKREADGVDDFFVFVAKVEFDDTDVTFEITVEMVETDGVAIYDDSSITIYCP